LAKAEAIRFFPSLPWIASLTLAMTMLDAGAGLSTVTVRLRAQLPEPVIGLAEGKTRWRV